MILANIGLQKFIAPQENTNIPKIYPGKNTPTPLQNHRKKHKPADQMSCFSEEDSPFKTSGGK